MSTVWNVCVSVFVCFNIVAGFLVKRDLAQLTSAAILDIRILPRTQNLQSSQFPESRCSAPPACPPTTRATACGCAWYQWFQRRHQAGFGSAGRPQAAWQLLQPRLPAGSGQVSLPGTEGPSAPAARGATPTSCQWAPARRPPCPLSQRGWWRRRRADSAAGWRGSGCGIETAMHKQRRHLSDCKDSCCKNTTLLTQVRKTQWEAAVASQGQRAGGCWQQRAS